MTGERPQALVPVFDAIPATLRSVPSWVLWRYKKKNGKWTKPPLTTGGKAASSTDPSTWNTFDEAVSAYQRGGFDGIGTVLTDGLAGTDLDHAIDAGHTASWAEEVLEHFADTYRELSPSGQGYRIFARGSPVRCGKGGPDNNVEVYAKKSPRYLTVTGHALPGANEINEGQAALDWLHAKHMKPKRGGAPTDDEVLAKARSASNAEKFNRLFAGEAGADHSAADMALIAMLHFHTKDATQLDRLFRRSALMRPKWDERRGTSTYGADTISKVCHGSRTESVGLLLTNTEMEIATEFARRGAGQLLFVAGMDWFTNAGPRWQRDEKLARFTLANELCRMAGGNAKDSARARIETNKTAAAIVTIARPDLIAVPSEFDVVPYELNTPRGVLDLRYGKMRQRTASDLFMHCTAVAPESRGIAGTVFADFLSEITCSDVALAMFVQIMLGATLFASSALEDHWLAFLVGSGRNGKGTLIEKCAARAMGSYARRIPAEVLLADDRGTRHPTEIANLVGARLAYASEIDEGRRWNESRLKELSGGDKLSGRFMRQDLFEFTPSHRLVIYANHRPIIQNPDPAFRARLKLVPFNASFVGREDTTLPDRLSGELPRILGWMVAGAADYWEAGRLANCAAVDAASAAYFEAHATFDAWIEERCHVGPEWEERGKALYNDFRKWKEDRGEGVPSSTRWGENMGARFAWRRSNGIMYIGVALRP